MMTTDEGVYHPSFALLFVNDLCNSDYGVL